MKLSCCPIFILVDCEYVVSMLTSSLNKQITNPNGQPYSYIVGADFKYIPQVNNLESWNPPELKLSGCGLMGAGQLLWKSNKLGNVCIMEQFWCVCSLSFHYLESYKTCRKSVPNTKCVFQFCLQLLLETLFAPINI